VSEEGASDLTSGGSVLKPTGKLKREHRAALLNFYACRPEVQPPAFIDELEGTLGFFAGDDRDPREITIGFRPAFVIFIIPPFPDMARKLGVSPPLHDQPEYTDKGFIVGKKFNALGTMSFYVAWKPAPAPNAPTGA